jgi:hypothetical protein
LPRGCDAKVCALQISVVYYNCGRNGTVLDVNFQKQWSPEIGQTVQHA